MTEEAVTTYNGLFSAEKPPLKRILCLGAGVNSTALLVLKSQGKVEFDEAIFADTGTEHPETYEYFQNIIIPFCMDHEIDLARISWEDHPSLYNYYAEKNLIPTRMFRHCTDKFKIRPINKYCQGKYGHDWRLVLGIDAGERQRAKAWDSFDYPLIVLGINRDGCKSIIRHAGLPIPQKSGCFVCPFMKLDGYLKLLKEHRDLYLLAEKLERNCNETRNPLHLHSVKPLTLREISLEDLRKKQECQTKGRRSLCEFMEKCQFCEVES